MTKICFLRTDISLVSGASIITIALANKLAERFEVSIASIYGAGERPDSIVDTIHTTTLNPGKAHLRENLLATIKRFRRFVKENGIDIVFSVGISPSTILVPAVKGTRTKAVLVEHSNRQNTVDSNTQHELLYRVAIPHFDAIVTLTEADRKTYLERYRVSEDALHVIPNWVNPAISAAAQPCDLNAHKILTVGRVAPVKGHELLVEAATTVLKKHPDWTWDLYGAGEEGYDDYIQQLIDEAGLTNRLNLMGPSSDIKNIYHRYSLFVLTSRYEGLPLVLLEAQANELPIVSFDCPTGPGEILSDGVNGFLAPCYDTDALAQHILTLVESPELLADFSSHAKDTMGNFAEDTVLKRWLDLIEYLSSRTARV